MSNIKMFNHIPRNVEKEINEGQIELDLGFDQELAVVLDNFVQELRNRIRKCLNMSDDILKKNFLPLPMFEINLIFDGLDITTIEIEGHTTYYGEDCKYNITFTQDEEDYD